MKPSIDRMRLELRAEWRKEQRENRKWEKLQRKALRRKAYDDLYALLTQLELLLQFVSVSGRFHRCTGDHWENFVRTYRAAAR